MSLHPHPKDARIKCLNVEQVQMLARLHGRVLKPEADASDASSQPLEAQSKMSLSSPSDADLRARLAQMETQVATLQAQLTDLTLQLLREREQHTEQRLLALEAERTSVGEHPFSGSASPVLCQPALPALVCHPTEKRNRLIPLIEYGTGGQYILIGPEEGELAITPDSPEWFAWLASLSSFRFVGGRAALAGCVACKKYEEKN